MSDSGAFAPDLRVGRLSADPSGAMPEKPMRVELTQPCVEDFGGLEDLSAALERVLGRPIGEAISSGDSNLQFINDALAQYPEESE